MLDEDDPSQAPPPPDFEYGDRIVESGDAQMDLETPFEIDPAPLTLESKSGPDDVAGSSVARSCRECRYYTRDCSMISTGKAPCTQCDEYGIECQPIHDSTMAFDRERAFVGEYNESEACSYQHTDADPYGNPRSDSDYLHKTMREVVLASLDNHSMSQDGVGAQSADEVLDEVKNDTVPRQPPMGSSGWKNEPISQHQGQFFVDSPTSHRHPSFVPEDSHIEQEQGRVLPYYAPVNHGGPGAGMHMFPSDPWSPERVSLQAAPTPFIDQRIQCTTSSTTGRTSSQDPLSTSQIRTPSTHISSPEAGEGGMDDSVITIREEHGVDKRPSNAVETQYWDWNLDPRLYLPQTSQNSQTPHPYPNIMEWPISGRISIPTVQGDLSGSIGHDPYSISPM
jgi:hypothetical protein